MNLLEFQLIVDTLSHVPPTCSESKVDAGKEGILCNGRACKIMNLTFLDCLGPIVGSPFSYVSSAQAQGTAFMYA